MITVSDLIFRIIAYLIDGAIWVLGSWWIITGFFGYQTKSAQNRKMLFITAILAYDILNTMIYIIARVNGKDAGVINGFLMLICCIYIFGCLREKKIWKKILLLIFTMEICVAIVNLVSWIFAAMSLGTEKKVYVSLALLVLEQIIIILLFRGMSWLSSRKRKEPMRFSLVVSTFVMFAIMDMIISYLEVDGYTGITPIVKIRLIFNDDSMDKAVMISLFAIMLVLAVIFVLMIIRESESDYFQKKNNVSEYYLETQKSHYESLMESNREIRKIKHDMKNHIYCLQDLYRNNQIEGLGKYLEELGDILEHADTNIHIGNEIADAIISEKSVKADKLGIKLVVDGDMYGVEMSALDTCTIFSNMIDNAIEACDKHEDDSKKTINLSIKKNNNFLLITEENPAAKKIDIQDNQIATTKKDKGNHGFGIINIKEAVERYDGECHIEVGEREDGYVFRMEIMIPME